MHKRKMILPIVPAVACFFAAVAAGPGSDGKQLQELRKTNKSGRCDLSGEEPGNPDLSYACVLPANLSG